MNIWDVTIPMHTGMACWSGDTAYTFSLAWKMSQGDSVNVGSVQMSVHTGTHADAPFHFMPEGATIDAVDPAVYVGPAVVVDVREKEVIQRHDLEKIDLTGIARVLLKTDSWRDYACFPQSIPVIAADVPAFLQQKGVVLLGLDVPSVDRLDSKDLPNHHALAQCGIHILESLRLTDVSAGRYELIALPLKIAGGDGAPVRAILRR